MKEFALFTAKAIVVTTIAAVAYLVTVRRTLEDMYKMIPRLTKKMYKEMAEEE